jgi:hypothetical protein
MDILLLLHIQNFKYSKFCYSPLLYRLFLVGKVRANRKSLYIQGEVKVERK